MVSHGKEDCTVPGQPAAFISLDGAQNEPTESSQRGLSRRGLTACGLDDSQDAVRSCTEEDGRVWGKSGGEIRKPKGPEEKVEG